MEFGNYRSTSICNQESRGIFERKERKTIFTNQEYIDLRVNLFRATEILKDILDKRDSLKHQQNESQEAYKVAKKELSKIATEKAILEAEGNEIGEELCEHYKQAKISFITAKQRCEILKTTFVSGKEEATKNLELAQEALKAFLCVHEEELIVERTELKAELEEAKKFYGFEEPPKFFEYHEREKALKPVLDDLHQVEETLSLICDGNHLYKRVSRDYNVEILRCERCGDEYRHTLPALWADP